MNESIIVFLSSLSTEDLNSIPSVIADMHREAKELEILAKLKAGLEMYNQFNILGKRMYSINECAEYVGIGKNRLAKYITGHEAKLVPEVEGLF